MNRVSFSGLRSLSSSSTGGDRQIVLITRSGSLADDVVETLKPLNLEFPSLKVPRLQGTAPLTGQPLFTQLRPSLVILDASRWTATEAATFFELRKANYYGSILLLTQQSVSAAKLADVIPARAQDLLFLESPFQPLEMQSIVSRVLRGQFRGHRVDRRYSAEVPVHVELSGWNRTTAQFGSRILELSRTGAYIQAPQAMGSIGEGDICYMDFAMADGLRTFHVEARVVRVDQEGFGVKFAAEEASKSVAA